jgi:phospholipid/cholesterol/gamma-HCH transport system substrate-binding protein
MATRTQKTKVGAFLIICLFMILGMFAYLSEYYEDPGLQYTIEFKESIQGLYDGAIVTYLGVNVGKVRTISVTAANTAIVNVIIDPNKVTLFEGVEAQLVIYSFASGTMAVSLTGSEVPGKPLPEGSRIPTKQATLTAVSEQIEDMMENLNTISDQVRSGLVGMEEGDLNKILEKVDVALENANVMLEDGKSITGDVREVVAKVSDQVNDVIEEFRGLSGDLRTLSRDADSFVVTAQAKLEQFDVDATQASLNEVLENVAAITKKIDATVAQLDTMTASAFHEADNVEYSLRTTLTEVNETFTSLQRLVEQLKQDPSSLVRGKGTLKESNP